MTPALAGHLKRGTCYTIFFPELRHLNLAPVSKLDIAAVAEGATKMTEPASTVAKSATMEPALTSCI